MMTFFDKLKSFIEKVNVNIFSNNSNNSNNTNSNNSYNLNIENLHLHLGNNISEKIELKDRKISIDPNKLEKEEKNKFNEILKEYSKQKDNELIEVKTNENLIKLNNREIENKGLIQFYKDEIPLEDYKILKAAEYINTLKGENLNFEKAKIRERFGDKGNRIINLYGAGYFESLKEIYNEDKLLFKKMYNYLVIDGVFTIFVHRNTNIEEEILSKINKIKTYRLDFKFINIHGLGNDNISKIKDFVNSNSNNENYKIKILLDKNTKIIVEIYIN